MGLHVIDGGDNVNTVFKYGIICASKYLDYKKMYSICTIQVFFNNTLHM